MISITKRFIQQEVAINLLNIFTIKASDAAILIILIVLIMIEIIQKPKEINTETTQIFLHFSLKINIHNFLATIKTTLKIR
jgi:hypothetical protein